jgi:hypothetical protein
MNNFTDGAPRLPQEWEDLGYKVIPCNTEGVPILSGWKENFKTKPSDFKSRVFGVRLDKLVDLDIDNPIMQKFLGAIICGAKFGRKSNPLSHLLFEGVTEYEQIKVPVAFEKYFKNFPHGRVLLDIRHGNDHFTYVPNGLRPHKKNAGAEVLDWLNFTGFQKYDTRTNAVMKEICLKTALSIMFPASGQRNIFVTSIAGILAKHTDWVDERINQFCFDLAFKSGHENPTEFSNAGTNARNEKTKTFGIPKLAEILEVTPSDISKLFAWVGVKDASSMFTELKVYNTDPKQWKLKFKDWWIDIWDTSILLSYTKIKILILENCMVEPPEIKPNDWKVIRTQLLANVKKEEAPPESSYYGMIGGIITNFFKTRAHFDNGEEDARFNLATPRGIAFYKGYYWFKLDAIVSELKRKQQSFEIRKLTNYLRTEFGAEPTKITIDKKELRVWKFPKENLDRSEHNNCDPKGFGVGHEKMMKQREEKNGGYRYKTGDHY